MQIITRPRGYVGTSSHPLDKRRPRYRAPRRGRRPRASTVYVTISLDTEEWHQRLAEARAALEEMGHAFSGMVDVAQVLSQVFAEDLEPDPIDPTTPPGLKVTFDATPIEPARTYEWMDPYPNHPALEADPHEGDLR